jgi:hypothetical protein
LRSIGAPRQIARRRLNQPVVDQTFLAVTKINNIEIIVAAVRKTFVKLYGHERNLHFARRHWRKTKDFNKYRDARVSSSAEPECGFATYWWR